VEPIQSRCFGFYLGVVYGFLDVLVIFFSAHTQGNFLHQVDF